MRFYTSTQVKMVVALVTGIAVVLGGSHFLAASEPAQQNDVIATSAVSKVYLSTSTVPVRVSGVVTAANSAIIYAQAAGVITELPAREGARITSGQLLARQATPVADAHVALATAERELMVTQQTQSREVAAGQASQAETRSYSAAEIATLRTVGNSNRTTEVSNSLLTAVEQGFLSSIEAVQFVNENRPLFSAEGLDLYDEVVADLYGRIPNYFLGPVLNAESTSENIQQLIKEMRNASAADSEKLVLLGTLATAQLSTLHQLFTTGESDVFDRGSTSVADSERAEYLTQRRSVLAAEQSLLGVLAQFQQVTDEVFEDGVGQQTNVSVTAIDSELAALQARYAALIATQSEGVARAGERVAVAEQSLGSVRAPFMGTVAKILADVGEYALPGTPLLRLVGTGARELEVSIPVSMLPSVQVGQEFRINDQAVGFVARVSEVSEGGSGKVIVALTGETLPIIGTSLFGDLMTTFDSVFAVPRSHVFFDTDGPYITYEEGGSSRVAVVYDTGAVLYVTVSQIKNAPLQAATSITL